MSTPAPPPIPDHQLLRRIGRGAYGEVWLAQNALGFYRAVKIVYRGSFEDDRAYAREFAGILRFEPISRLHESQIDILHVGRTEDCFYYVMELADDATRSPNGATGSHARGLRPPEAGLPADPVRYVPRTLESERTRCGRLPLGECVEIGLSLTTALVNLHKHGLVHRDIKPSNVIFIGGFPRLADIGLVRGAGGSGSFVGTEGFVAPEGPGTPAADLYSLGKVLYEISTGRDRHDFPAPPADLAARTECAAWFEFNEIVLRACEPQPDQRYQSAEEMHADLAIILNGRSLSRLRRVERRLKVASRFGLVSGLAALLAVAAYQQARHAGRVAREQLVRLSEASGLRAMEDGDLSESLLWFARTVELSRGESAALENHLFRFGEVWRQCPPLTQMFFHQGSVNSAEISADGRRVVTASSDHTAQVWDAVTGEKVGAPLVHGAEVHHAEFSADGRWVVTASNDRTARVWEAATGRPAGPPLAHGNFIVWAAFSPDGRRLVTTSWDNTARVWEAPSGRPVTPPLHHADHVLYAAFSPDGRRVITASADHTARLWDAATGQAIGVPLQHGDKVRWAGFSPDGRRIGTTSEDHTGRLWDGMTGEPLTRPLRHSQSVFAGAFSPDGRLFATAGGDACAQVWEVATGDFLTRLPHRSMVRSLAFSPDGRWLVTASTDHSARVWEVSSGAAAGPPLKHGRSVHSVRFAPDGRSLITASGDDTARVWSWRGDTHSGSAVLPAAGIRRVAFSPDGLRVLTASSDGTFQVWDVGTARPVLPQQRQPAPLLNVVFSPDGRRVLTLCQDGAARVWDAASGVPISPPLWHRAAVVQGAFSSDGRFLVTVSQDQTAHLWPLSPPRWSVTQIKSISEVLASERIDETGGIVPMEPGTLRRAWGVVQGMRPRVTP